jgi:hypothetical protein
MNNICIDDLKYKSDFGTNFGEYQEGYRIVYFSDNTYQVGAFSGNIEGFMMDFIENDPIEDESDIPKFISIDDILERSLQKYPNDNAVAIYKTDGTLIAKKGRLKKNIK